MNIELFADKIQELVWRFNNGKDQNKRFCLFI